MTIRSVRAIGVILYLTHDTLEAFVSVEATIACDHDNSINVCDRAYKFTALPSFRPLPRIMLEFCFTFLFCAAVAATTFYDHSITFSVTSSCFVFYAEMFMLQQRADIAMESAMSNAHELWAMTVVAIHRTAQFTQTITELW